MKAKNTDLDQAILAYKADLKGTFEAEIVRLEALQASVDGKIGLLDSIEKFNAERSAAGEALSKRDIELQTIKDNLFLKETTLNAKEEGLKGREDKLKIRERVVAGRLDSLKEREDKIAEQEGLLASQITAHTDEFATRCTALDARSAKLDQREAKMRQIALEIQKLGG